MVRSGVKHMILQCDCAVVLEGVSLFWCVCMWWEGGGVYFREDASLHAKLVTTTVTVRIITPH